MTLEEAIRTAIEYEVKVRDVYLDAVNNISDVSGKHVVEQLAAEEQGHVDYLTSRLQEWKQNGTVDVQAIPRKVAGPEQMRQEVEKLRASISKDAGLVADKESDIRMLERAVEVEQETSDFYQRMVEELSPEHREMFQHFLDIERGHLAIVEAELDSVGQSGFWFGIPEFDVEIG